MGNRAALFAEFDPVTGEPVILKQDRTTPAAALGGMPPDPMTGAEIVAAINAALGSATWQAGGGGAAPAGWQAVVPIAPDTTPVQLQYMQAGVPKPSILLQPPVSAGHQVLPPSDVPDGATYEILLVGGGAAGLWPAYSAAAPAVHGWVWLVGGAAPTSPSTAAFARSIMVRRRGFRHEAVIAPYDVEV